MLVLSGALAALITSSAGAYAQTTPSYAQDPYGTNSSGAQPGSYGGPPSQGPYGGPAPRGAYGGPPPEGSYGVGPSFGAGSEERRFAEADPERFFRALHTIWLRDDQRQAVRDVFRDTGDDRREAVRRIVDMLDGAQRHQLFAAMRNESGGFDRDTVGTVSAFGDFDLRLESGMHVRLHQGTVINPRGTTIRPGQRVAIEGSFDRDGTLHADRIDVDGFGRYRNY